METLDQRQWKLTRDVRQRKLIFKKQDKLSKVCSICVNIFSTFALSDQRCQRLHWAMNHPQLHDFSAVCYHLQLSRKMLASTLCFASHWIRKQEGFALAWQGTMRLPKLEKGTFCVPNLSLIVLQNWKKVSLTFLIVQLLKLCQSYEGLSYWWGQNTWLKTNKCKNCLDFSTLPTD